MDRSLRIVALLFFTAVALMAPATLMPGDLMSGSAAAQDYSLDALDTQVEPGDTFRLSVVGSWVEDVTGFTLTMTFPPAPALENISVDINNSLVGELDPDFVIANIFPITGELVFAVLFEAAPPFTGTVTLPPVGFPLLLAEIVGDVPAGTPDTDLVFDFVDGLGMPPVSNIFVVDFQSVSVQATDPGVLQVREIAIEPPHIFLRGDVNMDGLVDIGDALYHLSYTFSDGALPPCEDAGDANDDGNSDVSDAVFVLTYLFNGGAAPFYPFPSPGEDLTADGIGCDSYLVL